MATHQCGPNFFRELLEISYRELRAGRSLAVSSPVARDEKMRLFERALAAWPQGNEYPSATTELKRLLALLRLLFPGHRRVWVHARRRRLPDPDLGLLDCVAFFICEGRGTAFYANYASQYFCCDYQRLRLIPDARSAPRVGMLTDLLARLCPH